MNRPTPEQVAEHERAWGEHLAAIEARSYKCPTCGRYAQPGQPDGMGGVFVKLADGTVKHTACVTPDEAHALLAAARGGNE